MVPYSMRRHRLNSDEIEPVHDAALERLQLLVQEREPERLYEAGSLFRIWHRIHFYVRNKPSYPPHETYELIKAHLTYGTVKGREVVPSGVGVDLPGDAGEAEEGHIHAEDLAQHEAELKCLIEGGKG